MSIVSEMFEPACICVCVYVCHVLGDANYALTYIFFRAQEVRSCETKIVPMKRGNVYNMDQESWTRAVRAISIYTREDAEVL